MRVSHANQMTLDFDPALTEKYPRALDCVRACAYSHRNPLKTIAADMDMSQSELSRKLNENPGDPRHFTLDDLERFVDATGDTTPVLYLAMKYLAEPQVKQSAAIAALAKLLPDIAALVKQATADGADEVPTLSARRG